MRAPTHSTATVASSITYTDGGAVIDGAVTAGRDVSGRDQINITIQQTALVTPPPVLPPSNLHHSTLRDRSQNTSVARLNKRWAFASAGSFR